MIQQQDNYPEVLAEVVGLLARNERVRAEEVLRTISYERRDVPRRPALTRPAQLRIFRRDRWTCRYCGGRVIFTPVMALLGATFPDHFPYVATWKGGQTHPAVLSRAAVIDHVVPGSSGGAWSDPANLATACWPCNERKGDLTLEQLGWTLRPVPDTNWDGLTANYRAVWTVAGSPTADAHLAWLKAFDVLDVRQTHGDGAS